MDKSMGSMKTIGGGRRQQAAGGRPALESWVGQAEVSNMDYKTQCPEHDSGYQGSYALNELNQPAVLIPFEGARAFARALSGKERAQKRLPDGYRYRLLTRKEWQTCAQCGVDRRYPWGMTWPPTHGNYSDRQFAERFKGFGFSEREDSWMVSAPVRSGWTNEWSLYNVGGNVREWVYGEKNAAVICDASWRGYVTNETECAFQVQAEEKDEFRDLGFRLILTNRKTDP